METPAHLPPARPAAGADLESDVRFLPLLIPRMTAEQRARHFDRLAARIAQAPGPVAARLLGEVLHHLETMPAGQQERLVRGYADLVSEGHGSPATLSRLLLRADPDVRATVADAAAVAGTVAGTGTVTGTSPGTAPAPPVPVPGRGAGPPGAGDADGPLVALVVPAGLSADSFLQPPIDLLLAAARLRRAGNRVTLVDNRVHQLPPEQLPPLLGDPDVIAVTTTPYDHIQNYFLDYRLRHSFRTVDALVERCPRATVVVCGAHGTVRPDIVLRQCRADIVLKGEHDTGLPALVEAVVEGRPPDDSPQVCVRGRTTFGPPDDWGAIGTYRLNALRRTGTPAYLDDGEILPAYDLIDFDDYYGDRYVRNRPVRQYRWADMLATRGCAFDCSFCYNFWDRRVRYREPGAVAEELRHLKADQRVSGVFFADFHFTQRPSWVAEFCRLVRENDAAVPWTAQVRSDAVRADLLAEMASAGCVGLWFGVESFDPTVLLQMGKYRDLDISAEAVRLCREAGIEPHLFIMIGAPGETRDTLNHTLARMHDLRAPYCGVMTCTPRFGTAYYAQAKQQFPQLGDDFYGLRAVRGLVGNELRPRDLEEALAVFGRREFLYSTDAPRL